MCFVNVHTFNFVCRVHIVYNIVLYRIQYALIFAGCIFCGFCLLAIFAFNIRGRPYFAIAQEPDLNFRGSKLSRMASNP